MKNAGYNSAIAAGASTSFGFVASRASSTIVPTGFVLSGGSGPVTPPPGSQAPQAGADFAFAAPGQPVVINVLANDTDPQATALSVSALTQPAHGTAVLNADMTIRYTPAAGYTGADALTYTLRNAAGITATGNVNITIAPQGQWPAHVYAPYVDMTLYPIYDLVVGGQDLGRALFFAGVRGGRSAEQARLGWF